MKKSRPPQFEQFTTPGEAETWDLILNGDFDAAFDAANAAGFPLELYEGEPWEWFEKAWQTLALVALEQSCPDGELLPFAERDARLAPHFPIGIRIAVQEWLREVPPALQGDLLRFIYWFVRVERSARTGSPEFNSARSLTVAF